MKRLKGKIKTVKPTNCHTGDLVLHFCNVWEILIIDSIANGILYFKDKNEGLSIKETRVLVVEYHITGHHKPSPEEYMSSEEFYRQAIDYNKGLKQIPIPSYEWKDAINNKLVDTDKEVDFNIQISKSMNKTDFPDQATLLKSLDVFDDMRKFGLTSDQSSEICDYIDKYFIPRDVEIL